MCAEDKTIEYCAYCGGNLDAGFECIDCGTEWDKMALLHDRFKDLKANQQRLPADMEKILFDNFNDLYES